jgi:hypothetical protein
MHRKTREVPMGMITGFVLLLMLTAALLTGLAWLGSPAAAQGSNPWLTDTAVLAGQAAGHLGPGPAPWAPGYMAGQVYRDAVQG